MTPPPPGASERPLNADPDGWAGRAAVWLVPVKNPARFVYGLLTVGALMAAESGLHESYATLVGSALITTGVYWLLHAYSSVLGHRLASGDPLGPSALSHALVDEWAIVRGAAIPLLALIVSWTLGASQETGVSVALWSAVVSLVVFEVVAGVRSRATPGELALEVGVGLTMGVAILALRVILH